MSLEGTSHTMDQQTISEAHGPKLTNYEQHLCNLVNHVLSSPVKNALVVGAGSGTKLPSLVNLFPKSTFVATDVTANVVEMDRNIAQWGLSEKVQTKALSPDALDFEANSFDVVTLFDAALSHVLPEQNRQLVMDKVYNQLRPNGFVIGVCHNRNGVPLKALTFALKALYAPLTGADPGNSWEMRDNGERVKTYFYTQSGMIEQLEKSNFRNIHVVSMEELRLGMGLSYNRLEGSNDLVYWAQK